jgi:hypothetical protein
VILTHALDVQTNVSESIGQKSLSRTVVLAGLLTVMVTLMRAMECTPRLWEISLGQQRNISNHRTAYQQPWNCGKHQRPRSRTALVQIKPEQQ